jgi:hypothetical protein
MSTAGRIERAAGDGRSTASSTRAPAAAPAAHAAARAAARAAKRPRVAWSGATLGNPVSYRGRVITTVDDQYLTFSRLWHRLAHDRATRGRELRLRFGSVFVGRGEVDPRVEVADVVHAAWARGSWDGRIEALDLGPKGLAARVRNGLRRPLDSDPVRFDREGPYVRLVATGHGTYRVARAGPAGRPR